MISKKDLLIKTNISYGQLYRWKREGLIPEEWFVKTSTQTGQETFFDEDLIIPRINKILDLKDEFSIDDIIVFSIKKLKELNCFDERIIKKLVDKTADLNVNEAVILYALSKARKDVDKYFYKIKFDLTLNDFKNFDFANAKMALISKKREGYIIFYNDSLIASDNELEIKFYDLKDIEQELLEIIKKSSYKN
ncbi:MAG: DUF4004 family protein [Staphylococcus sp.]|nr:DUF4004 family protein [Staphylococcus sp.]